MVPFRGPRRHAEYSRGRGEQQCEKWEARWIGTPGVEPSHGRV